MALSTAATVTTTVLVINNTDARTREWNSLQVSKVAHTENSKSCQQEAQMVFVFSSHIYQMFHFALKSLKKYLKSIYKELRFTSAQLNNFTQQFEKSH